MEQISATPFGRRAVDCGLLAAQRLAEAPAPLESIDKWQLFDALRTARAAYGIGDRDLTVLNALLSFLPRRDLSDEGGLIVFPSNATLGARAHGMAESTLRRHIARLVGAGLIARHDSPNGKRYATRAGRGELLHAYGFSLRPLLVQAGAILAAAESTEAEARRLRLMREAVVVMLRDIAKLRTFALAEAQIAPDAALDAEIETLRTALRRKPELTLLVRLNGLARALLERARAALPEPVETTIPDGNDSQNERHHLNQNTYHLDSESRDEAQARTAGQDEKTPDLPLTIVLKACPDIALYAPAPIRSTADLVRAARHVHPMAGIAADVWAEAEAAMTSPVAAIVMAALLQRIESVRNPGGYLRHLTAQARLGQFTPGPMIMALLAPTNRRAA
ncbi:plasmid replication protein RepC [Paenirhodobacter enshiensis]|uniref:plasmid replication protein RepC n=1 Tax=Paenirhodobacter enshiensis TaxID=1105367 RepID=UPI003FA210F9